MADHDTKKPVFVEGGFNVWLRDKCLKYYILKSETTCTFRVHKEMQDKEYDEHEYYKGTEVFVFHLVAFGYGAKNLDQSGAS